MATGQVSLGLKLFHLKSSEEIAQIKIEDTYKRADWITGFGWNQNLWHIKEFPSHKVLDDIFPQTPVFFSRVDGHASWLNSAAFQRLKNSGFIYNEKFNGVLFEKDHIRAMTFIPQYTQEQQLKFLNRAQEKFLNEGFTHIRDMSMNKHIASSLKKMEEEKKLNIFTEAFVTIESVEEIEQAIEELKEIQKMNIAHLRLQGLKIFVDGSLGSKTAYLKNPYRNTSNFGLLLWTPQNIKEVFRKSWKNNLDVAVHCIGDAAADIVVDCAREVSAEKISGRFHIEHAQLLEAETIKKMKSLHVVCHMQPSHFLSDKLWLKEALAEKTVDNLFKWESLRKNKVPVYFGSDSPIEPISINNTCRALQESSDWGIESFGSDWSNCHQHSDVNWGNCTSEFEMVENTYKLKKIIYSETKT